MHTTHCLTRKIFKTAIYSGLLLFAIACTKQQTNNPSNGNGGGANDILPVAGFQYEISSTTPTVTFKDTSKNAVAWLWKFGDDVTSTEQNPTHTYKKENSANEVKLIVTSSSGKKDSTKSISVPIIFFSPIAIFSWRIPNVNDPATIEFKSNSLNSSAATWNFNDGTTTTGNIVSHTFSATNNYNVTLTVSNGYGGPPNSKTQNIPVNVISKIMIKGITLTHVPDNYVTISDGAIKNMIHTDVYTTNLDAVTTTVNDATNNNGYIITNCTWGGLTPATLSQVNPTDRPLINLIFEDRQNLQKYNMGILKIDFNELKSHYPSTKIYLSQPTTDQGGYLGVTLDVQYQL